MAQWAHWSANPMAAESVSISVLSGARLFPGNIVWRGRETHKGGQLLLTDTFELVPASWCRMDGRLTLPEDVDRSVPASPLAGDWFFLGSVHPHFGHTVLEGLARVWAFAAFAAAHPEGRAIVYEAALPDFAWELLGRAGIARDRVLTLEGPVQVERLHIPEPAGRTHRWIAPELARTLQAIGDTVDEAGSPVARTFLSRRDVSRRRLEDEAEIETVFAEAGFDVVCPETLDLSEQLALARRSAVLAGCIGSQMYLAAFQQPGTHTLVMAPSNFVYADDSLIAAALDHRLSIALGSPIRYQDPAATWTLAPGAATALIEALPELMS